MSAEPLRRPEPLQDQAPERLTERARERLAGDRSLLATDGIAPSLHPGSGHEEVPRYRRRGVVLRHRRPRRSAQLGRRLAIVLLLLATPLGLAWWLLTAPQFALRQILVTVEAEGRSAANGGRIPTGFAQQQLAPLLGENVFLLSLEAAGQRLEHPWVAGAAVGKELPNTLQVTLFERRPVALLESDEGISYLDTQGEVIAPVTPKEATAVSNLLRIAGAQRPPLDTAAALVLAEQVKALEQPWSRNLRRIEILGEKNYRLELSTLPFTLLVSPGSLEGNVEHFNQLLPRWRSAPPQAVDLRFRGRLVVQPVAKSVKEDEHSESEESADRG